MTDSQIERKEGRRRGRSEMRAARMAPALGQWPALVRNIPLLDVLNREGVELVHATAMRILWEIGVTFRDPESVRMWQEAGADIDGECVHISEALLMSLLASAPPSAVLHARNPARSVKVGEESQVFSPGYGSPYVRDLDGKRRGGTIEDFRAFTKLAQSAPVIHVSGGVLCEPIDVPVPHRHLHMVDALLRYSDKPFLGAVTAGERAEDTMAMAKLVLGKDFVENNAVTTSIINGNSPLVWDKTMLDALKVYARHNQMVQCSPFAIAGASTPASTVGAAAQLTAESLAAVAFGQIVRRGAPMVFGGASMVTNMKTGAPMFSTPEVWLLNVMLGQMARRYKLPFRLSGARTNSKINDIYAGYDQAMALHSAISAGAHIVMHTAGFLDSTLVMSYAKFVLDCEQAEMLYRFAQGPRMDDMEAVFSAIKEVGAGGHFLNTAHTLANFQSAFYIPQLQDFATHDQWAEMGALDAEARAHERCKELLARYEAPPLDPGIGEALAAFIRRREDELPASSL